MSRIVRASMVIALVLAPVTALAHPGSGAAHDLAHGFLHPLTGLDHVLAMVAIGLLAARLGGVALWLVPGAFVAAMAGAGAIAAMGGTLPYVEIGIAISVIALGATIAFDITMPVAAAAAMAAVFAVFHGYAHGMEMPATIEGWSYGLGFMFATALLHLTGIGLGLTVAQLSRRQRIAQLAGGAMAVIGVSFLIAG